MTHLVDAASAQSRRILLPIRLGIDPMKALAVVSFRGDAEFEAFEPQVFSDPRNGQGMRVLRYRRDGKVDVYWQAGVHVDAASLSLGAGIGDFGETAIEPARLAITARGVDVNVGFTDVKGRRVELQVVEDAAGKRPFPLLAPVGGDIARPSQLFLVFMPAIDLARRSATRFTARVGDRLLRPASLPVLLRGRRVLFTRYAADPIIGTLNPPAEAPLVGDAPAQGTLEIEGMRIVTDQRTRVTRINAGLPGRGAEMGFDPAFPNLAHFEPGDSTEGRWSMRLGGVMVTGGTYDLLRVDSSVAVGLDVTDPWRPAGLPPAMRLFTRVARRFRTWPTTYRWRGRVELGPTPSMSGAWERLSE